MLSELALESVDKGDKKYGVDYVVLPYVAGGETAVAALASSIHDLITEDYYGSPLQTLPLMEEADSAEDFDLLIEITSGGPGYAEYLRQWQSPYGITMIVGCISLMAPGAYPYLESGQFSGLITGVRGGAEYELLVGKLGAGTRAMDAVSISHLFVIASIAVGNIIYLLERSKRG